MHENEFVIIRVWRICTFLVCVDVDVYISVNLSFNHLIQFDGQTPPMVNDLTNSVFGSLLYRPSDKTTADWPDIAVCSIGVCPSVV